MVTRTSRIGFAGKQRTTRVRHHLGYKPDMVSARFRDPRLVAVMDNFTNRTFRLTIHAPAGAEGPKTRKLDWLALGR